MAVAGIAASSIFSFPRTLTSAIPASKRSSSLNLSQLSHALLPALTVPIPNAIDWNIPALLGTLWESILRAVPKKKTSYSKKRSRFLAGKALKDVTALNRCSACGHIKRAHVLCPYCVKEIHGMFQSQSKKEARKTVAET